MDFIRFTIWPQLKVRATYLWWIIKYKGKKNIPPDVIFKQMEKSMESMKNDLKRAFLIGRGNMNRDEFLGFTDLMKKVKNFEKDVKDISRLRG